MSIQSNLFKIEHKGQSFVFNGMLCRISKSEYLKQFQNGHIYMRPLREYIKFSPYENAKYDKYESSLNNKGTWTYHSALVDTMHETAHVCFDNPILCCMELSPKRVKKDNMYYWSCQLDKRMLSSEFIEGNIAEYGVLFFSKKDFIDRFKRSVKKLGIGLEDRKVTYSDTYTLDYLNPDNFTKAVFHKRKCYEYQSEYRFLLKTRLCWCEKHFDVTIPNLKACSFFNAAI